MAEQVTLQVAIDLTPVQAAEARVAALEARANRVGRGVPGTGPGGGDPLARSLGTTGLFDPFATAQIASLRTELDRGGIRDHTLGYQTLPADYDLSTEAGRKKAFDARSKILSSRGVAYLTGQDAMLRGAYTPGDRDFLAGAARGGYWENLRSAFYGSNPGDFTIKTTSPQTMAGLANIGWFPGVGGAHVVGGDPSRWMAEDLEQAMRQKVAKPRINDAFKNSAAEETAAFTRARAAAAIETQAAKPFFLKKAGPVISALNGGLTVAAVAMAMAKINRQHIEMMEADEAAGIQRSSFDSMLESRVDAITRFGEEIVATTTGVVADMMGAVSLGSFDGRKAEKSVRDFYNYGRQRSSFSQSRDEFEHEQMIMAANKTFHKASEKWNEAFSQAQAAASEQGVRSAQVAAKRMKQIGFSGPESDLEAGLRDRLQEVLNKRVTDEFEFVRPGRPMARLPQTR